MRIKVYGIRGEYLGTVEEDSNSLLPKFVYIRPKISGRIFAVRDTDLNGHIVFRQVDLTNAPTIEMVEG